MKNIARDVVRFLSNEAPSRNGAAWFPVDPGRAEAVRAVAAARRIPLGRAPRKALPRAFAEALASAGLVPDEWATGQGPWSFFASEGRAYLNTTAPWHESSYPFMASFAANAPRIVGAQAAARDLAGASSVWGFLTSEGRLAAAALSPKAEAPYTFLHMRGADMGSVQASYLPMRRALHLAGFAVGRFEEPIHGYSHPRAEGPGDLAWLLGDVELVAAAAEAARASRAAVPEPPPTPRGLVEMIGKVPPPWPLEMAGRRFADLPDPTGPLLELYALGFPAVRVIPRHVVTLLPMLGA